MSEEKQVYDFGGLKEYSLEEIENEVLNDTTYLDVFAGCDLRLKENIQVADATLQNICQIDVVTFDYKQDAVKNKKFKQRKVGFIAQELATVFPEATVKFNGDLVVDEAALVPHLVKGIQELKSIVETQQNEINELKKQLK